MARQRYERKKELEMGRYGYFICAVTKDEMEEMKSVCDSAEEMAKWLGVNPTTVSRLINGSTEDGKKCPYNIRKVDYISDEEEMEEMF